MNRQDREYMNQLSKAAFGASSRWQKILLNGVMERFEREHPIVIPHADGNGFQKKTVKIQENILRRYTQNELMAEMIGIVAKRKEELEKVMASFAKKPATVSIPSMPNGATVEFTDASGAVSTVLNQHASPVQST